MGAEKERPRYLALTHSTKVEPEMTVAMGPKTPREQAKHERHPKKKEQKVE